VTKARGIVTAEEKNGRERTLVDTPLDAFPGLYTPGPHAHARVEMSIAKAMGYGELRVVSRVVLECDQQKAVIEKAGELAFEEAKNLAITGFEILLAESRQEGSG